MTVLALPVGSGQRRISVAKDECRRVSDNHPAWTHWNEGAESVVPFSITRLFGWVDAEPDVHAKGTLAALSFCLVCAPSASTLLLGSVF